MMKNYFYKIIYKLIILKNIIVNIFSIPSKKNNNYYFFYDLNGINANFDYIVFLLYCAIKSKNIKSTIFIIKKKNFSENRTKERNFIGDLAEQLRIENIILKLSNCIENYSPSVYLMENRNEVDFYYNSAKKVFPKLDPVKKEFIFSSSKRYYKTFNKYYKIYKKIPSIKSKSHINKILEKKIKNIRIDSNKIVTITLRNSSYFEKRNTPEDVVIKFCEYLKEKNFTPIILDDFEKISVSNSSIPNEYRLFDECVIDLDYRIALYEMSFLNIFHEGGPPICGIFSKYINFLLFKIPIEIEGYPTSKKLIKESLGLNVGDQYSFFNNKQKIVWKEFLIENLIDEFNNFQKLP